MFNVPYNINTSIKVMIPYIYFIYLFNYEVLFNFLSLRSPLHAEFSYFDCLRKFLNIATAAVMSDTLFSNKYHPEADF